MRTESGKTVPTVFIASSSTSYAAQLQKAIKRSGVLDFGAGDKFDVKVRTEELSLYGDQPLRIPRGGEGMRSTPADLVPSSCLQATLVSRK